MATFIPKPYKTEQLTIRLPLELLEQVDEVANRYDLSRSAFINQCIVYALNDLEDTEPKTEKR